MAFTWVNTLDKVTNSVYSEMKTNIDYTIDHILYSCTSVNSVVNATVNSSVCSSQNSTYCSGVNSSNLTSNHSGQNSTYCGGVNGTNRTVNYNTQNGSVNSGYKNAVYGTVNNYVYGSGGSSGNSTVNSGYRSYVYSSDKDLKDLFGKIDNALDKILSINGYYYTGNQKGVELGLIGEELQTGVLAQEVKEIAPELVEDNFEGKGYMAVNYIGLLPILIEAVKEQQKQIDSLLYQLKNKEGGK